MTRRLHEAWLLYSIDLGLTAILAVLLTSSVLAAGQASQPPASPSPAIESHWAAAQEARNQGNYSAAEREYRTVIELAPRFAEAYMNLGLVYQLQERFREAMPMLHKALELKPNLVGANLFLGMDYFKQGEAIHAIPYLAAAAHEKPDQAEVWAWLATAQDSVGRTADSVRALEEGLDWRPQNPDLLYLLGVGYDRLAKEAIDLLQENYPHSTYAEQLAAENDLETGHLASALFHLQQALAASPGRSGLHLELGEVFLHAGNLRRAREEIDTELQSYQSLPALVRRGEAEMLDGEVDGALADWSKAIADDALQAEAILGIRQTDLTQSSAEQLPDSTLQRMASLRARLAAHGGAAAHFALAFLAAQQGELSTAIPEVSQVPLPTFTPPPSCRESDLPVWLSQGRLRPAAYCASRVVTSQSSVEIRLRLAEAFSTLDEYEGALKLLKGVPAPGSHSPQALLLQARCHKNLARLAYRRLYDANPNSYRVHQFWGDLYSAKHENQRAIEEYRKAQEQRPDLPNLHYQIGHLQWKDSKIDEALRELQMELSSNPRHSGALLDLGTIFLSQHQPDRAIEYLRRASESDPKNFDVHRFLGTAYVRVRQYARAETELKLALAGDHDGEAHYQLAQVYRARGQEQEAARQFETAEALRQGSHREDEARLQRLQQYQALLEEE